MTLDFTDTLPNDTTLKALLISGSASADYSTQKYLIGREGDIITGLYEIRYQVHCSPFKEALLIDNVLAVGFEGHFYLFNLATNQNLLSLEMVGYFGHLYYNTAFFYVADATGLHCIDAKGNIRWKNAALAIDGIIINEFTDDKIFGSGELDPPGGWKDFILDKANGELL